MNLEQLKIFLSVVESRSFTKAAGSMYISHSTTSRNVASLEESLGVRLLVRDNRSVRLTPAGEILYREGEKLLRKVEAIESAVKDAGLGLAGKLALASVDIYSYDLWSGYKAFCRQYPEVVLGMYHRDVPEVSVQVASGEADVGVTFSYALPEDMTEFDLLRVAAERFCAVAPIEHPLALRKSVKLSELRSQHCLVLPAAEQAGALEGLWEPAEATAVPTVESLFLQVRSGNGVAVVPYPTACEYGSNCAVLDIEDLDARFDVVMFWRRDNLNPTLPLFTETVKAHVRQK
jgi:DNA-binding transcriptional LysR family regulator